MEGFNWKQTNCHTIFALVSVMYTILFHVIITVEVRFGKPPGPDNRPYFLPFSFSTISTGIEPNGINPIHITEAFRGWSVETFHNWEFYLGVGVACQENAITHTSLNISTGGIPIVIENVHGDNIPPTPADPGLTKSQQLVEIPEIADVSTTIKSEESSTRIIITAAISRLVQISQVECVNEAAVRDKDAVKLKLKTFSSCEENKAKIQSILEHLCGNGSKLEIYQRDHTNEMIISGDCVEGDVKGMTDRFDNDNIRDKVGVIEAEPILVNQSQTVLISILIAGLLLAALLFAAYIMKTRNTTAKGARLAEELFQVDEQNQGNTLLSVAPLPPQEPVEKTTSNGESLDSPPTNGHSASQAPVADSEM